jgi:EAL domain-containing protein (putative c-di-GMP-specific phosphodiesterase class I)
VEMVETLHAKHIPSDCDISIIFEITETTTMEDLTYLKDTIDHLRAYGIEFSIDDFGTGYSSISYLSEVSLVELKIDKSFIDRIVEEKQQVIIKMMIAIARNLNLKVVAEGVETIFQRQILDTLECDLFQGYLFSKPLEKEEFEKLCCTSFDEVKESLK